MVDETDPLEERADSTTADSPTTPYTAPEPLIEEKSDATKIEYKELDHISPHSLPAALSLQSLLKIVLPAVITVLLIQRFSPLVIGSLALIYWVFQLFGPTNIKQEIMNGYQIDPNTAHEDEQLLYDLFQEICTEMNLNPGDYNLIIYDASGAASADPNNNNIFLTKDTIRDLSKTDLKSVLAHELTHTTHSPTLTKLYSLTTIPLPLIAAPIALVTLTPTNFLIILITIALFKQIASLTVARQMELESDREIPQHYHHHYAHALAQIVTSTPHIQSPIGRFLYSFIDSHPPINERIETTVDIQLPHPDDYKPPYVFDHITNLFALFTPLLFTIGLFEYVLSPEYALASGIGVISLSLMMFFAGIDRTRSISLKSLVLPPTTLTVSYALGGILTSYSLIPPLTTPTAALTHSLTVIGHFSNQALLGVTVGFFCLGLAAIPVNYFYNDSEPLETDTIHDDSHQEDALRKHYK